MSGEGLSLGSIGPAEASSASTRATAASVATRVQQLQELVTKSATATTPAGESSFAAALRAASAEGGAPPEAPEPPPATYSPSAYSPSAYSPSAYSPAAYTTPSNHPSTPLGASTPPSGASAYAGIIERAAVQNGVEPALLMGLIEQESGFDPNAQSGAGASGLTQLMPSTAASLGVTEPLNPEQSISGGARLLGQLLRQFGGNVSDALAAYNAGAGAVERYGGIPPYPETEAYVTKVLANAQSFRGAS